MTACPRGATMISRCLMNLQAGVRLCGEAVVHVPHVRRVARVGALTVGGTVDAVAVGGVAPGAVAVVSEVRVDVGRTLLAEAAGVGRLTRHRGGGGGERQRCDGGGDELDLAGHTCSLVLDCCCLHSSLRHRAGAARSHVRAIPWPTSHVCAIPWARPHRGLPFVVRAPSALRPMPGRVTKCQTTDAPSAPRWWSTRRTTPRPAARGRQPAYAAGRTAALSAPASARYTEA